MLTGRGKGALNTERPEAKFVLAACVVNLGETSGVHLDRQCFPLAAGVKHLQDVIDEGVQRQRWSGSTPSTAQMRQDKLFKLLKA